MNWSTAVRQFHRWVSIVFVAVVVAVSILGSVLESAEWIFYVPLLPLALLMLTGLNLFALPYVRRRKGGQATG